MVCAVKVIQSFEILIRILPPMYSFHLLLDKGQSLPHWPAPLDIPCTEEQHTAPGRTCPAASTARHVDRKRPV